jgi:hypothetical protein
MSETSSYTSPPERQLAMLKPRTLRTRTCDHAHGGNLLLGVLDHEEAQAAVRAAPLEGWSW